LDLSPAVLLLTTFILRHIASIIYAHLVLILASVADLGTQL
jgi:hypothetical protein